MDRTATAGDSYQAELLLQTPLVKSSERFGLLSTMQTIDRRLASNYQLASLASIKNESALGDTASPEVSADEWAELLKQAQLETKLVQLSDVASRNSGELVSTDAVTRVVAALNEFESVHRDWVNQIDSGSRSPSFTALWDAHSKMCGMLRAFYRDAVKVPGAALTQPSESMRGIRMLRLIDPRDAWRLADVDVESLSLESRIESMLQWQSSRMDQASRYSRLNESDLASATSEIATKLVVSSGGNPTRSIDPSEIEVSAPSVVDLQYGDTDELAIEVHNRSETAVAINLSLDYERDLIEVTSSGPSGQESEVAETGVRFINGRSQFGTRRSNTVELAPGQTRRFPLVISRRENASESTKLVFDVFARSSLLRSSPEPPTLLGRRTLDVFLPVGEVIVQHGTKEYVSGVDGVELLPFPNRTESFRFGVVNHSARSKQISMNCYALGTAAPEDLPSDPTGLLVGATPIATYQVTALGSGEAAFPLPAEPKENEADASSAEKPADSPGAKEEKKEEEPAEKVKAKEMPFGMIVVLTDTDTGQSTIRVVRFSVQRPRRFVTPRVGYDTVKKRITIEVSASDPSRLPIGTPVRVSCDLVTDLPGHTQGKLQGRITEDKPVANLFIKVDPQPAYVARLALEVDGYPRSFIFDVPCGKPASNVPEVADLIDVRMATSSPGGILAATSTIPVSIELNTPVGSFENKRDHLDLGIVLDGNERPAAEDSVRLTSDRSVQVGFVKAAPTGVLELHTAVADHLVELPAARLENLEIDVAATLTVDELDYEFPSIPLLIDTAAPVVGPVNRTDGLNFASVNSELDLTAWAWDQGSSVKEVEAAFDVDGSGEFPEGGPVFVGIQTELRKWTISVNAGPDPGKKMLLVRGIDQVGNASEPIGFEIDVLTMEVNAEREKQQTVDLVGAITLRGQPAPNAEVQLVALPKEPAEGGAAQAEPEVVAQVESADNGRYTIPGVPPGSYRLSARGVIRNRVHRTETEVTVEVGPELEKVVDVTLP